MADAQLFKYERPEFDKGRRIIIMCKTDRMVGAVQVLKQGGENNLHSHSHFDGMWMVLSGRVRFYGDEKTVIADLGKYEGIMVPRGFKYWFESVGDEELELLQVEASDIAMGTERLLNDRTDHTPAKPRDGSAVMMDGQTGRVAG